MRDHAPVPVTEFKGNFQRGEQEVTPQEYFVDSRNLRFTNKGIETRYGSRLSLKFSSVRRIATYPRTGEPERLLVLDNAGNLYDSTNPTIPILTIPGMTDFSMVPIFNRAYITPHDGQFGLANERVYVYDTIGSARPAAGLQVASGPITVVDGAPGNSDAGDHAIGVCYITRSGYITPPGAFFLWTSAGNVVGNVSNIPLGNPDFIVGRILVGTKAIVSFDGDFLKQTYFFIPNGEIDNIIDTNAIISFFDADLLDDASYLLDQIQEIPAGVGIMLTSKGRMITWGEKAFPNVFRASEVGQPESHSEVDGFGTVNPGDADNGVRNCTELRETIVICKSRRSYATIDNGDVASTWDVGSLDTGVGTECHGFLQVLNFGKNVEDVLYVVDRAGLRLFNGAFSDSGILTYNIDDLWGRISENYFHTIEGVLDPNKKYLAIAVPLDGATSPTHVLYADFAEGLKNIKWTTWEFPNPVATMVLTILSNAVVLKFGSHDGNLYQLDGNTHNDYGNAIDNWVRFALLPQANDDVVYSHTGCKLRIAGSGNLAVTAYGLDDSDSVSGESLDITTAKHSSQISLFYIENEKCSVKIRMNFFNQYFSLTKFTLYSKTLWDQ